MTRGSWGREKTERTFETNDTQALRHALKMWSSVDFSKELDGANVQIPFLVVVGGDQDFPGLNEELRNVAFERIATAGHYPM